MTNTTRRLRTALLAGASTALIAGFGASAAFAAADPSASTTVTPASSAIDVLAHKSGTNIQRNINGVKAEVTSVQGGVSGITDNGVQTGNTNTVSANAIQANAQSNVATQGIDLSLINATKATDPTVDPSADGIAALSVQTSTGNLVTSLASDDALNIALDGFKSGSATVTGNTIGAATTVNQATQTVAGTVPTGYTTRATGGASNLDTTGSIGAAGTVVVSTLQQASGVTAHSNADDSVDTNAITLSLTGADGNTVSSAAVLDSNAIAASTTLNTARNQISLQAGDAPAFAGSAVVSNAQSADASTGTSLASGNVITAAIQGTDPVDDINTLTGSLAVTNNNITSVAAGNDATGTTPGNRILLDDSLTFTGAGTALPGSSATYRNGDLTQNVSADLAISSSQGNSGTSLVPAELSAQASDNYVGASVQSISGGTIALDDNTVSASVKGNAVSSALASGQDAQGFTGSAAIANQQTNYRTEQTATAGNNIIAASTGYADGLTQRSNVGVAGNTVSASGYGNSASQSIALDATSLNIGSGEVALTGGTGGTYHDGNASASGGATIANLQSSYQSALQATQSNTQIGITANSNGGTPADTIGDVTTLSTTGNTAEAVAVANSASNSLSLTSNDVGSGAGIASAQIAGTTSSVGASLANSSIGVVASTDVANSTLTTSNNLERAIAYGGSASNALTVDSNSLSLTPSATAGSTIVYDPANPLSFSDGAVTQPKVNAAFGVLSDQSTQADVTASAGGASRLGVEVDGSVTSSTLANTANNYVAAAYGNDSANSTTLGLGNVAAGGFAAIGAIANTQSAGDAGSSISAAATGDSVIETSIDGDVGGSGVSTSDNAVQALAYGNRATGNVLTVTGNNLDSASAAATGLSATGAGLTAASSFSVQNAQAAHGSIAATQVDTLAGTSANVLTTIGGDIANASVNSDSNRLTAGATGNSGVNGVSLAGNQLASSTGVQNFQVNDAALSASIGLKGDPAYDGGPLDYVITGTGLTHDSDTNELTGGTLYIDASALDGGQIAYLRANGWALSSPNQLSRDADGFSATALQYGQILAGGLPESATVPATNGTPNFGGVTVVADGTVKGSQLGVDNNVVAGSVTGNTATNSLAVSGTSVADASDLAASSVTPLSTSADHALSNIQQSNSALASTVYSTFGLDTIEGTEISDSSLSVSGNSQSARAVANTAGNSIDLAGNDISAGSALSSSQSGGTGSGPAGITSTSNSEIFAPAAIKDSSVALSNNSNTSLAVFNDVTNTSTVSGTNVAAVGTGGNAALGVTGAAGGHVLANAQTVSGGSVTSEADTKLYNEDRVAAAGPGLSNSSATISGNSTVAEASSNRASNSLALNGSAAQAASAGVLNQQSSAATVTATAKNATGLSLNGDAATVPAASGSSVTIADNTTSALARGNSASNVLNVDAGSNYGTPAPASAGTGSAPVLNTQAQAAVLNLQGNTGAVSAYSQNVTYTVALNGPGTSAVAGSTVGVTGNSAAAQAYGNTANNTLTLTALNTGTPTAAVANFQTNSAAISATATSVAFGSNNAGGALASSSFGVNGNTVTATAVGNNAVSVIAAR